MNSQRTERVFRIKGRRADGEGADSFVNVILRVSSFWKVWKQLDQRNRQGTAFCRRRKFKIEESLGQIQGDFWIFSQVAFTNLSIDYQRVNVLFNQFYTFFTIWSTHQRVSFAQRHSLNPSATPHTTLFPAPSPTPLSPHLGIGLPCARPAGHRRPSRKFGLDTNQPIGWCPQPCSLLIL